MFPHCVRTMHLLPNLVTYEGGYYTKAATIQRQLLYEGGYYKNNNNTKVATIQRQLLHDGGYYNNYITY